ncbi:MAG TPA: class IV adenylate cyclase [Spirochaetales bacterium]|nr:class IV adenylate cyclase [Spirochaetales bacterium]MBP7262928.1 class IV adenylate cyclase [Spirochaetia bacterium]HPE36740.1 class IV adenylate cyclase [Spirochaetales bacterium]
MLEIELKARLRDPAAVEERLRAFARFVRAFDKLDSYWHGPDWRFARGTKGFRVRSDGDASVVTFKVKRNEAGIEINRETEFEVSDQAAFVALIERIGCEPFYRKRKTGTLYEHDGFSIELVEVAGLGHFLEIEKLLDSDDPALMAITMGGLKAVLAKAGVPESDIEGRSYSELILGGSL